LGGIWQGQYISDGYHWGFIFSNALDLLDGKLPYEEIFIQYGLLSTLIHALTLIIFDKNIFSLIVVTCIFYSTSLYLIGVLTYKFTLNKYYSFISTFIIFMIYPWPTSPWPNFISFFFVTLFCLFYSSNKKIYYILSGLSLGFAYLSYTLINNYVFIFFLSILVFLLFYIKNNISFNFIQKNYYFLLSFTLTLSIFFFFLLINDIFYVWITYQKLPFLLAENYQISIYDRIFDYVYFISFYPIKNFIYEPQWILFTLIFFSNLYFLIKSISSFLTKKISKINIDLFVINILVLSLNFHAQVGGISKMATSLSLGIITLFVIINSAKSADNKIIVNFSIIFIAMYSVFFAYDMNDSKQSGNRSIHLRDLKNVEEKYNNNIPYFVYQKWSKKTWHPLNEFLEFQNNIKKSCNLEFGVNLTSNTFYYALMNLKKIQVVPFFIKTHSLVLMNNFEPNFFEKLQSEIDNNNLLIITFENNDKNLNLNNYAPPKKIDLNIDKNVAKKFLYLYFPKKCEII